MSWDNKWEEIIKNQGWGMYPGEEIIKFMARNYYQVHDRSKIRVLDAGCGTGSNSWYIAKEGFSVVGVDGSPTGINTCKERFQKEGLQGEFTELDLSQALPFDDNYFDVVIDREMTSCHVLSEIKVVVDNLYRVIKPGGQYFAMMLMAGSYGDGLGEEIEPHTFITQTHKLKSGKASTKLIHFTSREEIDDIFSEFSKVEVNYKIQGSEDLKSETKEYIVIATK